MSKHDQLVSYVKKNSHDLFGEEIHWKDSMELEGANGKKIYPDLVGMDSKNLTVIVEVKSEFDSENSTNRRDAAHKSVGQVLNYANAYMKEYKPSVELKDSSKHLRLFIFGDRFSKTVENICQFLRMHGINIQHTPTE